MNRNFFIILIATLLIFALGMQIGFSQEKERGSLDTTAIMDRLDEVLDNQAEILRQFTEIKQELAVIKVRATR